MHTFTRYLLAVGCFLFVTAIVLAGDLTAQGYKQSVTTVDPSKPFVSAEGRFSIALPENVSSGGPLASKTPTRSLVGISFTWRMTEGQFGVTVTDSNPPIDKESAQQVLNEMHDAVTAQAKAADGAVLKDDILQTPYAGSELRFSLPQSMAVFRIFVIGNRVYQVLLNIPNDQSAQLDIALKTMDTFKVIPEAEAEAILKKRIADATPAPLPQHSTVKRAGSDAQDQGLKGKVKSVSVEDEDLSGRVSVKRKPTLAYNFNEEGNLTKRELYDFRGNLFQITVFGYVDGNRVEKSGVIRHEYDPPPPLAVSSGKADTRYSLVHKYKYDEKGRLTEDVSFRNDGKLTSRHVFNYKENDLEELVYNGDGALSQKYLNILGDKGEVKEHRVFDPKTDAIRDTVFYAYEYDAKGNWIKRTDSRLVTTDGDTKSQAVSVIYRTIAYY